MAFDPVAFREHFPEFADPARFPDSQLTFWGGLAVQALDERRWGGFYIYGLELYVAHFLALAAQNAAAGGGAAGGGIPGTGGSAVANKKVGEVSISYDNARGDMDGGEMWNLTTYGKQYLTLQRLIGQGCYQL